MGINDDELLAYVIRPTLNQLSIRSTSAEQLLLATASYHSDCGNKLHEDTRLGLFGITESLHTEVWDEFIALDCDLASQIRGMASQHEFVKAPHSELITNLAYATAIAWMIYQYRGAELEPKATVTDLTNCWQRCFLSQPISVAEREAFETCANRLSKGAAIAA